MAQDKGAPPVPAKNKTAESAPAQGKANTGKTGPGKAAARPSLTPFSIRPSNLDVRRKHFYDSLTAFFQEYDKGALSDQVSLESCMKISEQNSNDLAISQSKSREAADKIDEVSSKKNPTLGTTGYLTKVGPIPELALPGSSTKMRLMNDVTYDLKFTAQYLVTNFGNLENAKKIACLNYMQLTVGEERVRSNLLLKVLQSFFTVVEMKGFVTVAQQAIDAKQLQYRIAKDNYDAGTFPKLDVIQADVGLKQAQLEIIKAAKELELEKADMRNLMGIDQTKELDIKRPRFVINPEPGLEDSIDMAYKNRPEVTQLDLAVDIATTNVDLAYGGKNPTILLVSTYDFQSSSFASTPTQWSVGMNFSVPLLDGGETWAKVKQAKESLEQAKLARDQLKRDIALQVKSAHLSVLESMKRIETAEANLDQAKEAYEIALLRYQEGLSTYLELDNAILGYLQSHAELISAYCEYERSWASLIHAMGLSLKGVYYEQGAQN